MRSAVLLGVLCFALGACADPARERARAAGAYRLDKDVMRSRWIAAYDAMVDRRYATLPTEALRARERSKAQAAKARFREQFEQLDVTLVLDGAGTWTLRGKALEGAIERSGTWSLHAHVLTLVSAAGGPATTGRYDAGVITMRPEPYLPEAMIFVRLER